MAYTTGYEYDIFISYSHVDNKTPDKSEGWIDKFHKKLNVQLGQCVGEANVVKIWRDLELKGNEEFDSVISDRIKTSALFVTILSTGYFKSKYCQDELQCFHDFAQSSSLGLSVDNMRRIVNVKIADIDHNTFSKNLGRTSCFQFHDEKGRPMRTKLDEFDDQIWELAKDIHSTMDAIKAIKVTDSDNSSDNLLNSPQVSNKIPVFFADVPDSLVGDRDRVIDDLENANVEILKKLPPPYEAKPHEEDVIKSARHAWLTIHLLDQYPTKKIENLSESYDQKQLELCLEHGKTQWIWMPDDLETEKITNDDHKKFLNKIEKINQSSCNLVSCNRMQLTNEILDAINHLKRIAKKPEPQTLFNKVLLSMHRKDSDFADHLINLFTTNHIFTLINKIADDPIEKMKDFEDQLRQTRAFILIYNDFNIEWVTRRMMLAFQSIVLNNYPIETLIIYVPEKKANENFSMHPLLKDRVKIVTKAENLLKYVKKGGVQ